MANEIIIKATARKTGGSGEARRVRRAGGLPAALNLLSRETESLRIDAHAFMLLTRGTTSDQVMVTLDIDGRPVNALLREVQRDVISGHPIHIDFGEVDMTRKMRASSTIRLVGEPEGVRTQGGVLTQATREIVVECLPGDFVDCFTVDISALKVGESMLVSNLNLGDKYTIITHGDETIAAVVTVAEEAVEETDEAAAEAAAGEKAPEGEKAAEGQAAAPAKK